MLTLARSVLRKLILSLFLILALVAGCLVFGRNFGRPTLVAIDGMATVGDTALVRITNGTVLLSEWLVEPERAAGPGGARRHGLRAPRVVAVPVLTSLQAEIWEAHEASGQSGPIPGPVVFLALGTSWQERALRERLDAGERSVRMEPVGRLVETVPPWLLEAVARDGVFDADVVMHVKSTEDVLTRSSLGLILGWTGAALAAVASLLVVVERCSARRDGVAVGATPDS